MVDNTAGTAETVQDDTADQNVSAPFPTDEDDAASDVASDKDSQASATEGETAEAEDGDGEEPADGESDAENTDTEQKRNKVDAKTRIKQLSARARAAETRLQGAEQRQRSLEVQIERLEARERPGEAVDYNSDAEYAQALVADAVAAAKADTLKQAREDAANERAVAERDAWLEKSAPMRKVAPDFDAVISNPSVPITLAMKEAITGDDHGPEVVYFLGKNPAEAARIAALSPVRQVAEIGRLAERLSAKTQAKKTTEAPPPRKTLAGHGSPPKVDVSKLDHEQYRAHRMAQNAARRKASVPR